MQLVPFLRAWVSRRRCSNRVSSARAFWLEPSVVLFYPVRRF
jgi:hypothetical protein